LAGDDLAYDDLANKDDALKQIEQAIFRS